MFLAYAAYFDYKRRAEPEFRRNLRRNERQKARAEKEDEKAQSQLQRQKTRDAVANAIEEGFPRDPSEREMYFMEQVSKGEVLGADRKSSSPNYFLSPIHRNKRCRGGKPRWRITLPRACSILLARSHISWIPLEETKLFFLGAELLTFGTRFLCARRSQHAV